MRRDLVLTAGVALVLLATVPAYDRVFTDASWRGPALLSAGLALAIAVLVRRLRGGWLAAFIVSVVGLALTAIVLHVPDASVIPGRGDAGAIRELLAQSLVELRETPAPTQPLPGLMLLITSGYWLVAHAAHDLAVRRRRSGLALLPAIVLWAAPLSVPMAPGRTWPQALPLLAAAGLLLLLGDDTADEPAVSTSGLTVGAAALSVAVLLPAILPGYGAPAWVSLSSGSDPRGYQPIVDVSQRLQTPQDRDVLRVRSEQRTYLRLAGLDSFDGFTWRLGPPGEGSYRPDPDNLYTARDVLPPEEPAAQTEPVFVDVEVLALENIYVPAPYQPVRVLGPTRNDMVWSTDGGFLATWDTVADDGGGQPRVGVREGMTYRIQAARPSPSVETLREASYDDATLARWTELPDSYDALATQARAVYEDAGATTAVDQALALQDWFVGRDSEFTYDLDVPALRGDDALERFVLEDKVGYCEYFATAMAVMLRATSVPARVAVGFLPGRVTAEPDPEADLELTEYTVSTRDAHAWVEVLFPGHGWVTFEPTPRSDRTHIVPSEQNLAPTINEQERQAQELEDLADALPEDQPVPDSPDLPAGEQEASGPDEAADAGATTAAVPTWVIALIAAVGLAAVGLATTSWRHRQRSRPLGGRPADRVLAAQRRVLGTARRHGVPRRPSETAPEVLRRWRQEGRVNSDSDRFGGLAQAAAFGGDIDDTLADEAERLAQVLERALRDSVEPRDRLVAPVRVPAGAAWQAARRAGATLRRGRAGD